MVNSLIDQIMRPGSRRPFIRDHILMMSRPRELPPEQLLNINAEPFYPEGFRLANADLAGIGVPNPLI
jgi:hypothetical protein